MQRISIDLERVASALKELGHPTRLSVYRHLIKAGEGGMPVGALQKALDVPASTLSHHIAALVSVSLIKQERQGRELNCTAQYQHLQSIIDFLIAECCTSSCGDTENKIAFANIP